MAQITTQATSKSSKLKFFSFKGRQASKEVSSTATPLQEISNTDRTAEQNLSGVPTGSVTPLQTATQSAQNPPVVIRANNLNIDDEEGKCGHAKEKCGNCMDKPKHFAEAFCGGLATAACCCCIGLVLWKQGMH